MRTNKKGYIFVLAVLVIILLLFNVFVFAINRSFKANFWIGYLFTSFSYLLVCAICICSHGVKRIKNNCVFYSYPVILFSVLYLFLQLIVGYCVIFIKNFSILVSIVLQVALLLVYLIFIFVLMFYRSNTEQNQYETKEKRFFKNEIEVRINSLVAMAEGRSKESLEKIKEQVQYEVENLSVEQASEVENKIIAKLDELEECVTGGNEDVTQLCREIGYLLRRRNELCKNRM